MYPDFPEGAPCWADARLPDVEAGKRFYGDLFGWTFDEGAGAERGYYTAAYGEDRAVGALAPGEAPGEAAWSVHFAVRDAYAAVERVTAAGGRVVAGPVSDGAVATVARATGPEGAAFGLWQAGSHQGFERTRAPGALSHVQLRTPDTADSDPFYEAVFGYAAGHGVDDAAGHDADVPEPGLRHWRPSAPEGQAPRTGPPGLTRLHTPGEAPRFLLHFGVTAAEAACAEAARLGGHVLVAPRNSPYGRIAVLRDDQGAEFALWEAAGAPLRA
ncbi:VOC family protein [Streptomyces sp. NPDC050095]|uniref:VOC family protein n=1 Tax=unclassified Streptomyces TaxID=2593676 RepID=UPI003413D881